MAGALTPLRGLPPALDERIRVLVLGSMPGAASIDAGQYYAHPRNRFWPVAGTLFGFDPRLPYPDRVAALNAAGIGLWDVLAACVRPGSLDSAIRRDTEVANPIGALLASLPSLRAVALNGGKAAQAYRRHVLPTLASPRRPPALLLPSTSPANAGWTQPRLLEAWSRLREASGAAPG